MGKEPAGAVLWSDPALILAAPGSAFRNHQPCPGRTRTRCSYLEVNRREAGRGGDNPAGKRERLLGMDGHHRVPSHPGEKGARLYETPHTAPEQCLWLSGEPQELTVLRTSVQSHPTGTRQSLLSTFLHPTPNGYLLQPVLLQPFPLHLPPTSHSRLGLFHYLAHHFLPNISPPAPSALQR